MTDKDLDLSGFSAERRVDVPPPPKRKSAPVPKESKLPGKKGKKKKKASAKRNSPSGKQSKRKAAQPEPAKPPKPAEAAKATGAPKPGRKKRVNVSIPVDLSQRFTEQAAEEDRYLTDMVLDAYRNHYAAMRDEYVADRGDADLPFRPRRRKAVTGRVTHMLYLAVPEVAVIDGSAMEIGLSRSELVAQLVEREIG
jgi:hypothetical protein